MTLIHTQNIQTIQFNPIYWAVEKSAVILIFGQFTNMIQLINKDKNIFVQFDT